MKTYFILGLSLLLTCLPINAQEEWIIQSPIFLTTDEDLYSVYSFDTNNVLIAGSNGIIPKTTNGGLDWESQNSATTLTLSSIQFILLI